MNRRVLLLVSDGEQTVNTDRQAIITAAATFKSLGGIVIVIGARASGQGYDLLERVATGGFFLNALPSNASDVFAQLNYLKSILCAGFCLPAGDDWVNSPAQDYSSFENWSVIAGQVNLVGEDLLNFLSFAGLYVELNGGTPATLQTIDAYDLVMGRNYRLSLDMAGNQREAIAGQGIKVYIREVGVNDSDPNIFEQVVYPAWDAEFQTYSFTFNSTVNASVKLYVEQLYSGTVPTIGNFIDNVKFEEVLGGTTVATLLDDTFDTENLVYIPPRCGASSGLAAIADPDEPTIDWVADGGDDLNIHAQFNYGITYLTNEGETAVATVEYERTDTFGHSQTLRKLTIPQPDSDRVVGVRIWRSLGEEALDPTAAQLYLLAEVLPGQAAYFDQEDESAFTARHEPSVEAPTVNTTALATGALNYGYDYAGCCDEVSVDYGAGDNLVPAMTSNTDPSGVVSSGTEASGEVDAWLAFDHDLVVNTWLGNPNAGPGEWLQYQFPIAKTVTAYRLTSHLAALQVAPSAWVLRGSSNGITWTDLDTRTGITGWVDFVSRTFHIPTPGAYAYYRMTFTAVDGNPATDLAFSVTELELLGSAGTISGFIDNCPPCEIGTPGVQVAESPPLANIETTDPVLPPPSVTSTQCASCPPGFINLSANAIPAMTSNTAPSGTASASSNPLTAFHAFDRAEAPIAFLADTTVPAWWQYQFATAQTFAAYGVKSYKSSASPRDFQLQGSNNGTTWTTLDSRTDILWGTSQLKRWLIATPTAFTHYRLNITDFNPVVSGQQTTINLTQIELYTLPANPCASATAGTLAEANAAALLLATAQLHCLPIYTATEPYTANCETGFGTPVNKSATRQSLNSAEEASSDALTAAQTEAEAELDCEQSNNEQAITIFDSTGGFSKASPYPSVSFKEGLVGVITNVTVAIHGFTHNSPDDVRLVLVSPAGTAVELMRNCGGHPVDGASQVSSLEIVFDDAAVPSLPDGPGMVSGTFKPTRFGVAASLPSPCPPTPYDSLLSDFDGETPNGAWALYVVDDLTAFAGTISGGWELSITSA